MKTHEDTEKKEVKLFQQNKPNLKFTEKILMETGETLYLKIMLGYNRKLTDTRQFAIYSEVNDYPQDEDKTRELVSKYRPEYSLFLDIDDAEESGEPQGWTVTLLHHSRYNMEALKYWLRLTKEEHQIYIEKYREVPNNHVGVRNIIKEMGLLERWLSEGKKAKAKLESLIEKQGIISEN